MFVAVLTLCNLYQLKLAVLSRYLGLFPAKTLDIARFVAYLLLLLTALQLLLHLPRCTLSVCATLLTDDLLVRAPLEEYLLLPRALLSRRSCCSDPPPKRNDAHLLTRVELTDRDSGSGAFIHADCCWISCVPLLGMSRLAGPFCSLSLVVVTTPLTHTHT